jgi:glycosyltransferase involved in cell wall biosynthesis
VYEIIVIDDGSTDGTVEQLRSELTRVRVFGQPNLGPSVAHNTGVSLATGDWVCFLDDDDLWHRDKLRLTAEYIKGHPDCRAVRNPIWFFTDSEVGPAGGFGFKRDFVAKTLEECHAAVVDGDPSRNRFDYLQIESSSFDLMLERNRGVLSSTVVHRETLIRAGGFCPMQTCGDDWTMFVNVARITPWHLIPTRLGFTRLHAGQNTANPRNGLYALAVKVNAWHTGRAMQAKTDWKETRRRLIDFSAVYRQEVQHCFWGAVLSGHLELASQIRHLGFLLLPRRRDRLFTMIPPQITWRIERLISGTNR